ncbi:hypothetical protein [Enteractinococcus helveticum]|nr:hypothetical protein [Enteractinococcus helveticum]
MTSKTPGSMTSKTLRLTHRIVVSLILVVAASVLVLHLAGVISRSVMLRLFLTVELPLILAALLVSLWRVRQIRRATGLRGAALVALLQYEEPALRAAMSEMRTLMSLVTLIRGRRNGVGGDAQGFSYAKGSMSVPIVMTVLTVLEAALMHLLVPWAWVRIVLLVVAIYALVLVLGVLASRVVNPHLVGGERLILKWGHKTVLDIPLSNVETITAVSNHTFTQPAAENDRMVLTSLTSTNVRITLMEPVQAFPPVSKRRLPSGFAAREVLLYVADPNGFVRAASEYQQAGIADEAQA